MRINNLLIKNFRAIDRLELTDLQDVVVIAGANGCGKSQIYHAIRLLKSTNGSYQDHETNLWWSEFNIRLDRSAEPLQIFRDRKQPVVIKATFSITDDERSLLKTEGKKLITEKVWRAISQGNPNAKYDPEFQSIHQEAANHHIQRRFDSLRKSLDETNLNARFAITPDLSIHHQCSRLLAIVFSNYSPKLGSFEYHGADRSYDREQFAAINFESHRNRSMQHAMYNVKSKYNKIKQDLAAEFITAMVSEDAGSSHPLPLVDSMSELFQAFFPGKEFVGPKARPDGAIEFPVKLSGTNIEHDIDDLSSGEKEIVFGYLRLRSTNPRNSVILLDEPELHLNPALLTGLPQFYQRHLGNALGNQLWIVTHSDAILRESVGQPGYTVCHMQTATDTGENQITKIEADGVQRAIIDLVGNLAAYRPGAKIVIFEGGGDQDFDLTMTEKLFPELGKNATLLTAGNKARVQQLHQLLAKANQAANLSADFYSIVDRDCHTESQLPKAYHWDRYHIENYLLDFHYIGKVLADLQQPMTEQQIESKLRNCAEETKRDLARQELEAYANERLVGAIKTSISRDGKLTIANALSSVVVQSSRRIQELVDSDLTKGNPQGSGRDNPRTIGSQSRLW